MSNTSADSQPPRRPRGRPPGGVRQAILAATLQILTRDGLAQLTTREVARQAGVSEASVFYHFGDKVNLLQEVMIAALAPLKKLDATESLDSGDPSTTLMAIATALDRFFDQAMPVFSAVQADSNLRQAFAARLLQGDRGPHRGVRLIGDQLRTMKEGGHIDAAVDEDAVALMLVGACFLSSWQRFLAGPRRRASLPGVDQTVRALVQLIQPPEPVGGAQ